MNRVWMFLLLSYFSTHIESRVQLTNWWNPYSGWFFPSPQLTEIIPHRHGHRTILPRKLRLHSHVILYCVKLIIKINQHNGQRIEKQTKLQRNLNSEIRMLYVVLWTNITLKRLIYLSTCPPATLTGQIFGKD